MKLRRVVGSLAAFSIAALGCGGNTTNPGSGGSGGAGGMGGGSSTVSSTSSSTGGSGGAGAAGGTGGTAGSGGGTCKPPLADCDGNPSNGCETDTDTDPLNCHTCGHVCPGGDHATAACSGGSCTLQCDTGFADCDGDPSNGCEVDTTTDLANCGGCGSICNPGPCTASVCQENILAATLAAPFSIAIDSTHIYWVNQGTSPNFQDGSVMKMKLAGGATTTLASNLKRPTGVAVDTNNVYWTTRDMLSTPQFAGSVQRVALNGGTPQSLATGQNAPFFIASDGTHVYWTSNGTPPSFADGAVLRVPATGGTIQTLAMNQAFPFGIALDATNVYWTNFGTAANGFDDGTIAKIPLAGGALTTLATAQGAPYGIIAIGNSLFWANDVGGEIMTTTTSGGAPTMVSSTIAPALVTANATDVYWSDYSLGGAVDTAPQTGGTAAGVATAQDYPIGIALDGTYVYWADEGPDDTTATGSIRRAPK